MNRRRRLIGCEGGLGRNGTGKLHPNFKEGVSQLRELSLSSEY